MIFGKTIKYVVEDQMILADIINNCNSSTKPRKESKKENKTVTLHRAKRLLSRKQRVINAFKRGIFPMEYTRFSFSDDLEKNLNVRISKTPTTLR